MPLLYGVLWFVGSLGLVVGVLRPAVTTVTVGSDSEPDTLAP